MISGCRHMHLKSAYLSFKPMVGRDAGSRSWLGSRRDLGGGGHTCCHHAGCSAGWCLWPLQGLRQAASMASCCHAVQWPPQILQVLCFVGLIGLWFDWSRNSQIPKFPDSHILRFPHSTFTNSQILRFPDHEIPKFPNSQIPKFSDSQVSRFSDSQIPKFSDSQVPRFSDSQILRLSESSIPRLPRPRQDRAQWVWPPGGACQGR